jgi:hypothetical protein
LRHSPAVPRASIGVGGRLVTLEGSVLHKRSGPRSALAVLLAMALHGLLVVGLLRAPEEPAPRETVVDVMLAPPWRRPLPSVKQKQERPPPSASERPSSRPSRPVNSNPTITPRTMPNSGAWQVREAGPPEQEGVRQSLRTGVGCRSADFLSLTKAERAACDEKLAAGAKDAPAYAVVSPKLKKEFDGVFECPKDDVWCEYKIGKGPYPGLLTPRRKKQPGWD